MRLQLDAPPPFWSENRAGNWRKNMRLHKAWSQTVQAHAGPQTGPPRHGQVNVTLTFPTVRRRDPHNYVGTVCKAIVDGLVTAGVFPDDTPEWVTVTEPTLRVGRPQCTVDVVFS